MPKINRELKADLGDAWFPFEEWFKENPDPTYILDLDHNKAIEIAKKRNKEVDEILEENHANYYKLREDYEKDLEVIREEKQQLLTIRNNLLDSIASVYERADSILTGLDIEVRIGTPEDSSIDAPAWNDGKVITFNEKIIKDNDENTIMGIHGLNYHELAHLLYSPRIGTELGQWVMDNDLQLAFNILEDNRAETYLVEKYPATRNFLIATLGDYILEHSDNDTFADNFILLAGRRYFSYETRAELGKAYARKYGSTRASIIWRIVNAYRTLVFPRDYDKAKLLIRKLRDYLPPVIETPNGCGARRPLKNGRPETGKQQEGMNLQGDSECPDFGKESESENKPAELNGNSPRAGNSGDEDSNKPMEKQATRNQSALDKLTEEVTRAKQNKELQNKVRETQLSITKSNANKSILSRKTAELLEPTAVDIATARMFAQELEQLRIEADPAWLREKPSGRLNMKRAMNSDINDIGKLFDRWEIGNDNHDIEAVLLLDHSGSMSRDILAVCRSSWVIKRAIEQIDGRVSVVTFNHVSKLLYSGDERATEKYRYTTSCGGTDPHYGLIETERIMLASQRPTKLVVLLTDGQWYGDDSDKIIARMKEQGCLVVVVFLGQVSDYYSPEKLAHGANIFRAIAEPSALINVAKDIVRQRLLSY